MSLRMQSYETLTENPISALTQETSKPDRKQTFRSNLPETSGRTDLNKIKKLKTSRALGWPLYATCELENSRNWFPSNICGG